MREEVSRGIEGIRAMGMVYSFDGFSVADFLTQLDRVVEIHDLHFGESRLTVNTGKLQACNPDEVMALIPAAAMLNVANAYVESVGDGALLVFEWILPKQMAGLK